MLGQVVLGKYKVTRLMDEGGMSKIYLARHVNREMDVVVKVLKEHLLAHSIALNHFRREIFILFRFQHPHVVVYYDALPSDRQPVLVMEYLRGLDLGQLLHQQRRLTPERTGNLLGQLCLALQAAHDAGIVHRDLKPGNLMVLHQGTPRETLKLMDFGLAKMSFLLYIAPEELVDFTLPAASGTPEYMSPEQGRGNEVDGRADLYSLGIILYEMLTGRRPFLSDSVEEVLDAHAAKEPPTFADLGQAGRISSELEEVVRSCLAKHPDDRPQSALELAQRYERALGKPIPSLRRAPPTSSIAGRDLPSRAPTGFDSSPHRAQSTVRLPMSGLAVKHHFEATMPEAMAMIKIKGFINDLGGEIIETVPGLIRVRLADRSEKANKGSGFFSWVGGGRQTVVSAKGTDIELYMERAEPGPSNRLAIILVLRPNGCSVTPEWRARCDKIGRDLKAYLMGR